MSWAVTGDVGERGPVLNMKVFTWLQNIHTSRIFNTVKGTGLCLGKHNPATSSNVFETLFTIQTKIFFNTVDWAGPCLGATRPSGILNVFEKLHCIKTKSFFNAANWAGPWQGMLGSAAQQWKWMFLHGCITSKRNGSSTPWKELAVLGGAQPSHKFECLWKLLYYPEKKNFQHRETPWTVFGGTRPTVYLNVVESLHNIKTKWFFNVAKWAGPWQGMLGSAAQP